MSSTFVDRIHKRHEVVKRASTDQVAVLGQQLRFPVTGRKANNRFLKAALSEQNSVFTPDNLQTHGMPTQQIINLYDKWGHGGFGMILTSNFLVDHRHLESTGNIIVSKETINDERRKQLKKIASVGKSDGALMIAQLSHAGRQTPVSINPTPFSSSDYQLKKRLKTTFGRPVALTVEQIRTEVVERFVFAAKEIYAAGFDGIQLHGAHGYLLCQFISQWINRRTDRYGGSIENRIRIVEEIYNAIRKEIPVETGFIVGIKMNSADSQQGTVEDVLFTAQRFEKLGFDFIELSGGTYEQWEMFERESTRIREAFFIECAKSIKPSLERTVLYLTGGFRTVPAMIKAVSSGEVDGIGLGRPITTEPDFPNKVFHYGVQSTAVNYYEQDFTVSAMQSMSQMAQAGLTPYVDTKGDPCFGVSDLSNPAISENFSNGCALFGMKLFWTELMGHPFAGVFLFDETHSYSSYFAWICRKIIAFQSRMQGFRA